MIHRHPNAENKDEKWTPTPAVSRWSSQLCIKSLLREKKKRDFFSSGELESDSSTSGSQTNHRASRPSNTSHKKPSYIHADHYFYRCVEVKGQRVVVPAGKVKWLKIPCAWPSTALYSFDLQLTKSAVRSGDLPEGFHNQRTFYTLWESADWQLPGQLSRHKKIGFYNWFAKKWTFNIIY